MRIRKGSILISTIMIMTTIVVSVSLITASITLKRRFVNLDSFRVQKDLDQRSIQVLLCSYTKCVVDEQWRHMADTCYEKVGSMQIHLKKMSSMTWNIGFIILLIIQKGCLIPKIGKKHYIYQDCM